MVTAVGIQSKFEDALYELCELDYDAIEAYEAAINRLDTEAYRAKLRDFKKDHERHVEEIRDLLAKHMAKSPSGASTKALLTQGKVVLAQMMGDISILKAMLSNEMDTNTAYERLNTHAEKWKDAEELLVQGLQDERKHKEWLEMILQEDKEDK